MINLKNNIVCSILILVVFFSFNIFGENSTKENYLGYLKYAVKFETKRPYYLKKAKRIFFKEGWSTVGAFPQAIKRNSFFEFYSSSKKRMNMSIEIENNNFRRMKHSLIISIYLNNTFITKLKIDSFRASVIEFPEKIVKKGINELIFSIESQTPTKVKGNSNFPGVWFLVKNIYFDKIPDVGRDFVSLNGIRTDRFYQPSNSHFFIAIDTDEISGIELKSGLLKNRKAHNSLIIEKIIKDSKSELFLNQKLLYGNQFKKKMKFKKTDGKILLKFNLSSNQNKSYFVWKEFNLIRRIKNKIKRNIKTKKLNNLKNIFIIVLDALRYDLINKKVDGLEVTPNINIFSKSSYSFTNYYANAPYTEPSVASMFTGLLPEVHTVRFLKNQLPKTVITLQAFLKAKGFNTHAFTGNPILLIHDLLRGFDTKKLIFDLKKGKWSGSSHNNIKPILNLISNIDKNTKKYIYIHLLPPHTPYNPPDYFKKKFYSGKLIKNEEFDVYSKDYIYTEYMSYLNNVTYADDLVGKIVNSLKQKNIFNDSLIIITSDHGEAFAEHNVLRHGKTVHNEMIHIPFLIKLPFQTKKNIIDNYYSHIDLFPTVIDLIGKSKKKHLQGISLFTSENMFNRSIYSRTDKLLNAGIYFKNYKYIYNSGINELYNINEDKFEKKDLSKKKIFLNVILKQKLFIRYFKNKEWQQKIGIKPFIKNIPKIDNLLKTLGYL